MGFTTKAALAETLAQLVGGSVITNSTSQNALSILQNATVPKGRTNGGALFLNNTGNQNTGLTLYSDQAAPAQPLVRMEIDNPNWDEEVLYIRSDSGTSRGLIRLDSPAPEIEFAETDQTGASGKFEVRVQHDTFQINSRRSDDTTFENKMNMTHAGDLELVSGALKANGTKPSEFKGGINITGGCIALDGTCISTSALGGSVSQAPSTAAVTTSLAKLPLVSDVPRDLDCNSYQEQGAMQFDTKNNRLYICNGPTRGWDYATLSN
ncbi:MAG: hypothetical protein AAB388_02895 [Patescibacteria group bacterium]